MEELLRLLAEDAPGSELARAAGEDAVARDLALRIRAGIDASKKREAELSALVDVARELASARDPGGVLDTIVHRARTLIGTDVAYLTLYDAARGDTYMRATDGSVSAAFQQVRLPLGAGLGGLVAETYKPYWTADYPSDRRFRHTSLDRPRGRRGGAGRHLRYAAHRRRSLRRSAVRVQPHAPAVQPRGGLAARLTRGPGGRDDRAGPGGRRDRSRRSTSCPPPTPASNTRPRPRPLRRIVLSGGDVDAIAAAWPSSSTCGSFWSMPSATSWPWPGHPGRGALAGVRVRRLTRIGDCWVVAATAKGERLGALVIGGVDDLSGADQRIVERAAVVTALVLLFRRQAAEQSQRAQADLLADVLSGSADPRTLTDRLRLLAPNHRHDRLVVAVCRGDHSAVRARLSAPLEDKLVLSGPYGGDLVLLLARTDPARRT